MKLVFVISAYNREVEGRFEEHCKVEVFAKDEKEAIEKAKKLIKKNNYIVAQIIEVEKK